MNKHFNEKETLMMKKEETQSASLVIQELQIKTTVSPFYIYPLGKIKIWKSTVCGEGEE